MKIYSIPIEPWQRLTKWDRIKFFIIESPYWIPLGFLGLLNLINR